MLEFKRPSPAAEQPAPRWNIGVERNHVIAFVAVAVVAGFGLGFLTARLSARPELKPRESLDQSLATPNQPARAETPSDSRRVTRIIRADTIEIDGIGVVRLIGVETPDGKEPRESYQIHGQNARDYVEKALLGQDVRLDFDSENAARGNKDEQGQTLAYVYTADGRMINSELVRLGYAFVRGGETFRASNDFRLLERDAVQNQRGVWGSAGGSSSIATATPGPSGSTPPLSEAKKIAPLPPSALGTNIPALTTTPSVPTEALVLVSPTDHQYHKAGCELLDSKKKRSMGLSEARGEGYTACSRCFASTVLRAP